MVRLAGSRVGRTSGIFRGFRGDVYIPIGALAYVADARVKLSEQRLTPLGLGRRLIEGDVLKLLAIQRVHEEVPFPVRKPVTCVKDKAGRLMAGTQNITGISIPGR